MDNKEIQQEVAKEIEQRANELQAISVHALFDSTLIEIYADYFKQLSEKVRKL